MQIYEETGVVLFDKDGKKLANLPGLTKDETKEIIPELVIDEEQSKLIDEKGWFKLDYFEETDHAITRAKEVIGLFKEMAKG